MLHREIYIYTHTNDREREKRTSESYISNQHTTNRNLIQIHCVIGSNIERRLSPNHIAYTNLSSLIFFSTYIKMHSLSQLLFLSFSSLYLVLVYSSPYQISLCFSLFFSFSQMNLNFQCFSACFSLSLSLSRSSSHRFGALRNCHSLYFSLPKPLLSIKQQLN